MLGSTRSSPWALQLRLWESQGIPGSKPPFPPFFWLFFKGIPSDKCEITPKSQNSKNSQNPRSQIPELLFPLGFHRDPNPKMIFPVEDSQISTGKGGEKNLGIPKVGIWGEAPEGFPLFPKSQNAAQGGIFFGTQREFRAPRPPPREIPPPLAPPHPAFPCFFPLFPGIRSVLRDLVDPSWKRRREKWAFGRDSLRRTRPCQPRAAPGGILPREVNPGSLFHGNGADPGV